MNRAFKGIWIPRALWLERTLKPNEKALLMEVDSLDNGEDGCTAQNGYLADFLGCGEANVSMLLSKLEKKGLISREITYFPGSKQVQKRTIHVLRIPGEERDLRKKVNQPDRKKGAVEIDFSTPFKILNHPIQKIESPYSKFSEDSNTLSINTLLRELRSLFSILKKKDEQIEKMEKEILELRAQVSNGSSATEANPEANDAGPGDQDDGLPVSGKTEGLPESEMKIRRAADNAAAYFNTYPALVQQCREAAKEPGLSKKIIRENLQAWIRHHGNEDYFLRNITKHITGGQGNFLAWMRNYQRFGKQQAKPTDANPHAATYTPAYVNHERRLLMQKIQSEGGASNKIDKLCANAAKSKTVAY